LRQIWTRGEEGEAIKEEEVASEKNKETGRGESEDRSREKEAIGGEETAVVERTKRL
jgi:hypothetical protein